MDTGTTIAIIVVVALVVIGLAVFAARRKAAARDERLRYEAEEHRNVAAVTEVEADRRAAEAEERAARAKREQLAADQARLEAEQARTAAADARTRADELDPDVDLRADADPALDDATSTDRPRTV